MDRRTPSSRRSSEPELHGFVFPWRESSRQDQEPYAHTNTDIPQDDVDVEDHEHDLTQNYGIDVRDHALDHIPEEADAVHNYVGNLVPPFPLVPDAYTRRFSIPTIRPPEKAWSMDGRTPISERGRSSSLPTMASIEVPEPPEVRKVVMTMSPYRRDALFQTQPQPLATIRGDRLVTDELERTERRASIVSLERFYTSKRKSVRKARGKVAQLLFQYTYYLLLVAFVYFVLVGRPLWHVMKYSLTLEAGCAIFIGISAFYAVGTLFTCYEPDPEPVEPSQFQSHIARSRTTALIIPCYKAAELIGPTVEAALKTFPPENIYVVANGNSPTPLDNTEEVCRPYKVNHLWVPIGSKIVAQFVGTYAAYKFPYVLLIDDDCALPPAFPIVSERIQLGTKKGLIKCVGYTIKAVGAHGSKGNVVQQLQDIEYKLSGMQRQFSGSWGSAVFAHGAIALWERDFLLKCFRHHPGFAISEDWYFGLVCRDLGGRIVMCSSVLVETEVPSGLFFGSGARGGFGEMTVYKQRFYRWNFFIVFRLWQNLKHMLFSWNLGIYKIGDVIYSFQEWWVTILYITTPFLLPIGFMVDAEFMGIMTATVIGMYFAVVIIFNEVILRKKKEMVSRKVVLIYYMPYKFILRLMNVVSVYWSIWEYAHYFAQRHPQVIEDERVVELVICSKQRPTSRAPPETKVRKKRGHMSRMASYGAWAFHGNQAQHNSSAAAAASDDHVPPDVVAGAGAGDAAAPTRSDGDLV